MSSASAPWRTKSPLTVDKLTGCAVKRFLLRKITHISCYYRASSNCGLNVWVGEGRSVPFDVDVLDLDVGKLQECLISPLPKEKDATPVYSHKKPDPGQRRSWWDVRKINLLSRRVTDLKARCVFHEYENISSSYWERWKVFQDSGLSLIHIAD